MSTDRTFQAMLNEYLPNELLKEEIVKRDYFLQNCEKDNNWKGGKLIVPFKGAQASSVRFGKLTAASDVAEDAFVRGEISTQPEVWGTMKFHHRDVMEHEKLSEQNFLKLLPDTIEDFLEYMKMCISLSFTNGSHICALATDGAADGSFTVERVERLTLKQKVYFVDGDTAISAAGYIQSIDVNTGAVTVDTTRAGGVDLDISAYTVAQGAKMYFDGSSANGLTSLKASLLSYVNSGSESLYGHVKTLYPYLQAIQIDGSTVTSANLLDQLFDGYTRTKNRGKGSPNVVICSYKHLGTIMKLLEDKKGSYHQKQDSMKVNVYGWTEIDIIGVKGSVKVVATQEMDDDWIPYMDMRAVKIYSNGFFRKRKSPEGKEYFEVRGEDGFYYLIDTCFFGDLVLQRPSYCGVMHSISYN